MTFAPRAAAVVGTAVALTLAPHAAPAQEGFTPSNPNASRPPTPAAAGTSPAAPWASS